VVQREHRGRRRPGQKLDGILIGEIITALDRVRGVQLHAIVNAHGRVDPPLAGSSVGPQRVDFRDQRDVLASFFRGQGRAHPGDSAAHDQD
jgi:hypothetical protein